MTVLMNIHTQYPALDDTSLAQQARRDPEAFAELYHRHLKSVYRYHLAHTGNVKDAEDLTSQTFMAALEGIHSYRGTGPYIAWLMGIASRNDSASFAGAGLKSHWTRRFRSRPRACQQIRRLSGVCKWIKSLTRSEPSALIGPKP